MTKTPATTELTPSPAPLRVPRWKQPRDRVKAPTRKAPRAAVRVDTNYVATVSASAVAALFRDAATALASRSEPERAQDAAWLAYAMEGGAQTCRMGQGRDLILSLDPSYERPRSGPHDLFDQGEALASAIVTLARQYKPRDVPEEGTPDAEMLTLWCDLADRLDDAGYSQHAQAVDEIGTEQDDEPDDEPDDAEETP